MAGIRCLLIVALFAGALPVLQAARPSRAREEWMTGYVKLEEGAKAEEANRPAVALGLYRQALTIFREVQRKYPSWNPSLLTYRVNSCETRIERLRGTIGEQTATMKKADLEVVVRAQVAKIHELAEANRALKTDLNEARDAMDRARREAARSVGRVTDIRDLVKERKVLQDKLATETAARTRVAEELRALQEKGGLKAMTDRLQVELDQVTASKAKFEESYNTYRRAYENVKQRLQKAMDAREKDVAYVRRLRDRALEAEKRLEASADALTNLQTEWQSMKDAKDEAQAKAKAQTGEAEAALARLDPLRKENEQLRRYRDQAAEEAGRSAGLQKQLRELTDAKANAVAQADGLRADLEKSIAAAAGQEQDLTKLQQQAAAAQATTKRLGDEAAVLAGRVKQAEEERDTSIAESRQAKAKWDEDRQRLLAATASAGAAGKEMERLRSERSKLVKRVEELAEQRKRAEELEAALAAAKQEVVAAKLAGAAAGNNEAAAAKATQEELAAAEAAKELAETQLAAAARKLKTMEEVVTGQKKLLEKGEAQGQELAGLGKQLKARERRLEETEGELRDARRKLEQAQKIANTTGEEARAASFKIGHAKKLLALAEKRVQDLDQQLAAERRNRAVDRGQEGAVKRLQEAGKMVKALEGEAERLKAKSAEQLQMLRNQEQAITKLEAGKAGLDRELAERDRRIEKLNSDRKLSAAKTDVAEGLATTLEELDAELAKEKQGRRRLESERDRAMIAAREARARLKTTQNELNKVADRVARKGANGASADIFRDQIRRLTIQLEKEGQRRRTLEELLSKLQDSVAEEPPPTKLPEPPGNVPPPADRVAVYPGAQFPEAEEKARRERDRKLVVRGYLRQGIGAEEAGNVEAARHNYAKVLENEPDNRLATQRLGLIAAELGEDREAIRFLKRAFRLDADDLDTLLPLGFALVRQSEPDLAVSMLSRAVALEPDNPHAHRCLGIACSTLGWFEAAEVQFRRTDKLNPKDGENAFNMAVLLATREPPRLAEGKTWYVRARKLGAASDPGLDRVFGIKAEDGE